MRYPWCFTMAGPCGGATTRYNQMLTGYNQMLLLQVGYRVIAYDRATIGGVVKRLLEKGVISRVPAPDDRRAFRLELTRGGQSWLEELCPLVTRVQETILAGLSEDERAVFMTLMEKTLPATP